MSVTRRSSPPPPKGPGDLDAPWQGLGWVLAPPQSRKAQASLSGAWARGPGLLGLAQHAPARVACSLRSDVVHGILQARILKWVLFFRGSSHPRY